MLYVVRIKSGPWFGPEDIHSYGIFGPIEGSDLEQFFEDRGFLPKKHNTWEKGRPGNTSIIATVIPVNNLDYVDQIISGKIQKHLLRPEKPDSRC